MSTSVFIQIGVVAGKAINAQGQATAFDRFKMRVRPEHVAGVNPVTEGPTDDVLSVVYFHADSGIRQVLSSDSPEEIDRLVTNAEAYK